MTISPGYSYEKAPQQELFLQRTQTIELFQKDFDMVPVPGDAEAGIAPFYMAKHEVTWEIFAPWVAGAQRGNQQLVRPGRGPAARRGIEDGGLRHRQPIVAGALAFFGGWRTHVAHARLRPFLPGIQPCAASSSQ